MCCERVIFLSMQERQKNTKKMKKNRKNKAKAQKL
jgi:hypothetical protein